MNFDRLVARTRQLITHPRPAWEAIDGETLTSQEIYLEHVVILAAIPAVAAFVGYSVIGIGPFGHTFRVPVGIGLAHMLLGYLLTLGGVYLFALVIDGFAQKFEAPHDFVAALKLAGFAPTPAWLAGALNVIPSLWIIGVLLGIYSLYLLFVGLPILMKVPARQVMPYAVMVIVTAIVLPVVLRGVTDLILPAAVRGY